MMIPRPARLAPQTPRCRAYLLASALRAQPAEQRSAGQSQRPAPRAQHYSARHTQPSTAPRRRSQAQRYNGAELER